MSVVIVYRRLRAILLNGLVRGGTRFIGITAMVTALNIVHPAPPAAVAEPGEGWFFAASAACSCSSAARPSPPWSRLHFAADASRR